MVDKGKQILNKLTREQSDKLSSRIIAAMENSKSFRKAEIIRQCYCGPLETIRYSQEAVKYGVQAVIDLFLQTGMLIQEGKTYYIAQDGKRVEEKK